MNQLLHSYENTLYANYSSQLMNANQWRVFEAHVVDDIQDFPEKMQNPFKVMIRWLKFEILDIEAILEAIGQKNEMEKRQLQRIELRDEERLSLKNILEGKESFKTFFMSKKEKVTRITNLTQSINAAG